MISLDSVSFSFDLDILRTFTKYIFYSLTSQEILKSNTVLGIFLSSLTTGLGIVIGNLIVNLIKYNNQRRDVSKVLNLAVETQADDFFNIHKYITGIQNIFITHYSTLTDCSGSMNGMQSVVRERKNILKYIEKIRNLENTIRTSYTLSIATDSIKMFASRDLILINEYLHRLKIVLEDLKIFYSYELPDSMNEFNQFSWESVDFYMQRMNSIRADIDILLCLSLILKEALGFFKEKENKSFDDTYQRIAKYMKEKDFMSRDDVRRIIDFKSKNKIYRKINK